MICHIQNQILTHDGQTDEAKISTTFGLRRSADINAGETGAIVSSQKNYDLTSPLRYREGGAGNTVGAGPSKELTLLVQTS